MTNTENNKRIAKNTAMLYFRMLIIMSVSLYTSRIILNTLGVEDFGIYNVVGGFVTMFAFLNNAMSSSTQRFLTVELGRKDYRQLTNVFSMSVNIHFLIAGIIFVLSETVGLWFLNTQLTIPAERIIAANWVYQFSIMALLVSIVSVPYNAIIIAHERMNVFAWISIVEVGLKLLIVFMLQWFGFDKLKLYAVLLFSVSLIIRIIYGIYCRINFSESKFSLHWDKPLFKILISFASWNLWGSLSAVLYNQGINVLLNIFFGPVVNAARAIAYQIRSAVDAFVQNFQMALRPQIIKSYASDDLKYMHQLVFQGAKYSFFLLFILTLPILLETKIILNLWLKTVPDYTVVFTRLVIINILIDVVSGTLMTAAQASGKIKLYQGIVGGLLLLNLPVSYLFLKLGFSPEVTLYISIGISIIAFFARLKIVCPLVNLSIIGYFRNVVFLIMPVSMISLVFPLLIQYFLPDGFYRLIIVVFSAILSVTVTIFYVGLSRNEQIFMLEKFTQGFVKIRNKK